MQYDINLPDELKILSIPKFKLIDKKLIIVNKPSFWNLMVPLFFITTLLIMTMNGKISFEDASYNDYLVLSIILVLLVLIQYISLNKVSINFEEKLILIKNYNPLVNLTRKLFKLPFLIPFNEIEKVYPDWSFWGKNIYRYNVILETDAPYKFRIAIFSNENQSIIFTDYLNEILKHYSIHTDAVSDTTVLN